jgi:hypothetical protein
MRQTISYVRGAGTVSVLLALAALMFLPDYFAGFVALVYMAIVLSGCDLFFETYPSKRGRYIVAFAMIAALVGFSVGFAWVKAPLPLLAVDNNIDYAPGTFLGGIPWLNEYDDIRVVVTNPTDHDYSDVDLTIKPNLPVASVSQISGSPCSFSDPTNTNLWLADKPLPAGRVTGMPMVVIATDVGERVRCDKIPRHASIEIILAAASPRTPVPGSTFDNGLVLQIGLSDGTSHWFRRQEDPVTDQYWKPRTAASWVRIWGGYTVLQRRRYVSTRLDLSNGPSLP